MAYGHDGVIGQVGGWVIAVFITLGCKEAVLDCSKGHHWGDQVC
jgi:hypothetical protein